MLLVCVRGVIVHARYALPSVYIDCAVSMSTVCTRKTAQNNKKKYKFKKLCFSKHRTHDLCSDGRSDCLPHHLRGVRTNVLNRFRAWPVYGPPSYSERCKT